MASLTLNQVKRFTTLQPKDEGVAQPDVVLAMEGSPNSLSFGFSKTSMGFTPDDQEMQFTTWIGHLLVKAKFETKDMVYRGKLAL
jgi:hypothetical protein